MPPREVQYNGAPVPFWREVKTATSVAVGVASAATAAAIGSVTGGDAVAVRITSDTAAFINFGVTPVAAAPGTDSESHYLPANIPQDFAINPEHKMAIISADGVSTGTAFTKLLG